jgi:hypothetical protein
MHHACAGTGVRSAYACVADSTAATVRLRPAARRTALALVAGGLLVIGAAPTWAEPVFTVATPASGGPKQYDRVSVQRFGRPAARTVLVLTPGKYSGAGVFTLVARELVARVPSV